MKAPPLDYVAPASLADALRALAENDNARVLAGGQSLVAMLNMRFAFPDCLVDLNRVEGLDYIREDDGVVRIGAMTRQRSVEYSPLVQQRLPILHEAILCVGHRQTRNRGTVGGSLCQLDPSAEIPTIAMAMDAVVHVASQRGRRDIAMADFPAGYMSPALEPDELVEAVSVTPWAPGHGACFIEYARRHGDFAIASVAILLQFGSDDVINRASVTLGGVGAAPLRVAAAEGVLQGSRATDRDLEAASTHCGQVEASGDTYAPAWYRQRLARVLSLRAMQTAVKRARR